ncbi:hypothetical protein B0T24DRAFT_594525 [Lasiosphaeria ovina]|uniref:Uncharacterized protein n=1 Tax=Lasiosphaeria ovina TaxID=92902 RepID=A0AAE0KDZ9_9PEZI|nr:hypothetical protein B0T24DRAFT_594525 [Lasiosphaeria ovina]
MRNSVDLAVLCIASQSPLHTLWLIVLPHPTNRLPINSRGFASMGPARSVIGADWTYLDSHDPTASSRAATMPAPPLCMIFHTIRFRSPSPASSLGEEMGVESIDARNRAVLAKWELAILPK